MRLPAPLLACGCASCKQQLNNSFERVVNNSYDVDELCNLMLLDSKLSEQPPTSQTLGEMLSLYTLRDSDCSV